MRQERREYIEKVRPLVEEKYGKVRASDVIAIERIELERIACIGCTGECPKKSNRYLKPIVRIDGGVLSPTVAFCKYGERRFLERDFRSARIPSKYLGKTFDDYRTDASNRVAVDFAKQALTSKRGAYFYGECGTGKTFLAALIAQDFLKNDKSVVFVKVPSLLDDIRDTFKGNGNEIDLLDRLKESALVVLDDFGMEKSTQWAGSTLCKVLDMRYDNPNATTIITSNLSLNQLAAHLNNASDGVNQNGNRIADRCREICKPILLKGTTRRN